MIQVSPCSLSSCRSVYLPQYLAAVFCRSALPHVKPLCLPGGLAAAPAALPCRSFLPQCLLAAVSSCRSAFLPQCLAAVSCRSALPHASSAAAASTYEAVYNDTSQSLGDVGSTPGPAIGRL